MSFHIFTEYSRSFIRPQRFHLPFQHFNSPIVLLYDQKSPPFVNDELFDYKFSFPITDTPSGNRRALFPPVLHYTLLLPCSTFCDRIIAFLHRNAQKYKAFAHQTGAQTVQPGKIICCQFLFRDKAGSYSVLPAAHIAARIQIAHI